MARLASGKQLKACSVSTIGCASGALAIEPTWLKSGWPTGGVPNGPRDNRESGNDNALAWGGGKACGVDLGALPAMDAEGLVDGGEVFLPCPASILDDDEDIRAERLDK